MMIAVQMPINEFDEPVENLPKTPASSIDFSHYKEIGQTLLCCEVADWKTGIPWLFPTARVCKAHSLKIKNTENFTRLSLANVSIATLEAYCSDLESCVKPSDSEKLFIQLKSSLERYSFSVLATFVSFVLCFYFANALLTNNLMALILSIFVASITGFSALAASTDLYRRNSFYRVICREILRRRGIDGNNPNNKVKIFSTEANFS
jgi:hypothetical protein